MGSMRAQNARAISAQRFTRFEENERSVKKPLFNVFYTSNEPVTYHQENRFEGRSSYQFYYPTGETHEQELEKIWFEAKNKELADKRRDEEALETMKDWGMARGRMESEIARKKEHVTIATNFKDARGWKRNCWKTKNHQPAQTFEEFINQSSSSESEDEMQEKNENTDGESPNKSPMKNTQVIEQSSGKKIDFTEDPEAYNFRPSSEVVAKQLQAIDDHNSKLPPRKKAKESLPEISA